MKSNSRMKNKKGFILLRKKWKQKFGIKRLKKILKR